MVGLNSLMASEETLVGLNENQSYLYVGIYSST